MVNKVSTLKVKEAAEREGRTLKKYCGGGKYEKEEEEKQDGGGGAG